MDDRPQPDHVREAERVALLVRMRDLFEYARATREQSREIVSRVVEMRLTRDSRFDD